MIDAEGIAEHGTRLLRAWTRERGTAFHGRATSIVLTLLILCDAKIQGGLPTPTTHLIRKVLCELVPNLVDTPPRECSEFPHALHLLIDYQRHHGAVTEERHTRLRATVTECVPTFDRLMRDPTAATWPRLYTRLLRWSGVNPADHAAVTAWLDTLRRSSDSQRRTALLGALGITEHGLAADRALRQQVTIVSRRTDAAAIELHNQVLRAGIGLAEDAEAAAEALHDHWTASGMVAALNDFHQELCPRGYDGEDFVSRLCRICGIPGHDDATLPLPPGPDISEPRALALIRTSPLLAAAARLASCLGHPGSTASKYRDALAMRLGFDIRTLDEVLRLAMAVGFCEDHDGRIHAGDGLLAWRGRDLPAVLRIAVTSIDALLSFTGPPEYAPSDQDDHDDLIALTDGIPATLVDLYRDGAPESLARLAAVAQSWIMPPTIGDARWEPSDPGPADPAPLRLGALTCYQLPPDHILAQLIGRTDLTCADRTELRETASCLAVPLDRLAALGIVRRTGDLVDLTEMGRVVLRAAFHMGGVDAPSISEFTATSPDRLVRWVTAWPPHLQARWLHLWLEAQPDPAMAWRDLMMSATNGPRECQRLVKPLAAL